MRLASATRRTSSARQRNESSKSIPGWPKLCASSSSTKIFEYFTSQRWSSSSRIAFTVNSSTRVRWNESLAVYRAFCRIGWGLWRCLEAWLCALKAEKDIKSVLSSRRFRNTLKSEEAEEKAPLLPLMVWKNKTNEEQNSVQTAYIGRVRHTY